MVAKAIVVRGKTYAAAKAVKIFLTKNSNKSIVVIVPTEVLKIQWMQALNKFNLLQLVSVEIINSAIKKNTKIDFIILDECHRYGSDLFYSIFEKRTPGIVLGLSATYNRLDGKHELLNKFCPVCDFISIQEAIENNWLSPYREYKVLLEPHDINTYRELNSTFLSTFTFFNMDFQLAMDCVGGKKKNNKIIVPSHIVRYEYAKSLCTLDPKNPRYASTVKALNSEVAANAFSWNRALQERKSYIMNHPLKIEVTRQILMARPDSKAITFSATIKQAEKIGGGYIVHSGNTKKKNKLTLKEFSSLPTGVIHSSKSLDEGVSIEGLNLAVILCNSSSKTQKTQRVKNTAQ